MSYYCERINCNCKYCDEEDGCIFFSQGSGNEIDMPCYEVDDTISILHKVQELCKELDVQIEVNRIALIFRKHGEIEGREYLYSQAFSLFEIEHIYGNLDNCADEFLYRHEQVKEKLRGEQNDSNGAN